MSESKSESTRRGFFLGLFAAAGALAALGGGAKEAKASAQSGSQGLPDPVLYRRTEEVERYYRTLYY